MTTPFGTLRAPRGRAASLVAALAIVLVAGACEDPFQLRANRPTTDVSLEAWAITGTSPTLPSVLLVPVSTMTRPDAAGTFDLAFDIDANGRAVVLPVGSVVLSIAGQRPIGFLRTTQAYDAILEAPRTGWTNDSTLVLSAGDIFLVRVQTSFCQFDFRQEVYAKFRIDSIIPAERRMRIGGRINPNCGFRSLQTGVPEF